MLDGDEEQKATTRLAVVLLRRYWPSCLHTAQSRGWDTLSNGALLDAAEEAGFAVLLTTDRRIRYQQNLHVRRIALVVLTGRTRSSSVRQHAGRIDAAIATASPGRYAEVDIPFEPKRVGLTTRSRTVVFA